MKLPTLEQIEKAIKSRANESFDGPCEPHYHYLNRGIRAAAEEIITLFKTTQFDENASTPEIDPNLIKIAELEAKIFVYEQVIGQAGFALTRDDLCPGSVRYPGDKAAAMASVGLSFETAEECQRWIDQEKARQVLRRDAKGFKPNIYDLDELRHYVFYDPIRRSLDVSYEASDGVSHGIVFATEPDALASIKAHETEWKTFLGVSDEF